MSPRGDKAPPRDPGAGRRGGKREEVPTVHAAGAERPVPTWGSRDPERRPPLQGGELRPARGPRGKGASYLQQAAARARVQVRILAGLAWPLAGCSPQAPPPRSGGAQPPMRLRLRLGRR